jgi:type IV pilus biogenesis protein PilP
VDKKVLLACGGAVAALLGISVATGRLQLGGHKAAAAHAPSSLPPPLADPGTATHPSLPPDSNAEAANAMLASLSSPDATAPGPAPAAAGNSETSALVRPGELAKTPESVSSGGSDPQHSLNADTSGRSGAVVSPPSISGERDGVQSPGSSAAQSGMVIRADSHSGDAASVIAKAVSPSTGVSIAGSVPMSPESNPGVAMVGAHNALASAIGPSGLPTGEDLIALQGELSVIQKQQAIATAQEAIANANLNAAKAKFELTQIGRAKVEEKEPGADRTIRPIVIPSAPATPRSTLESLQLVGTTAVGSAIVATIKLNGRLTDVRDGSLIAGSLVEKVTPQSLIVLDQGRPRTFFLN